MATKTTVYAFPKPGWIDTVSCDGKPCGSGGSSCGSHPATTAGGNCKSSACGDSKTCDFGGMLSYFGQKYSDVVQVEIADYSSISQILRSLEELNTLLENNLEGLRVTFENLELVFSQIAPIVAIDGTLAFVGKTPSEEELLDAVRLYRATAD